MICVSGRGRRPLERASRFCSPRERDQAREAKLAHFEDIGERLGCRGTSISSSGLSSGASVARDVSAVPRQMPSGDLE